jgi:3-deoxy-D-manno-octulosonic-acid transferase
MHMLLNLLYQSLWLLAPPFLRRYLRRRAKLTPAYALNWRERFGKPYPHPVKQAIWIHVVSVGETRASIQLIRELQQLFPATPLLITQTTPTGRATAQHFFPQAQCRYLPYDKKTWVQQFLHDHQPKFGVIMETEIWPNLIEACAHNDIPLFMANARLSEKSLQGYLKVRSLVAPPLSTLAACYAQTNADVQRLKMIGAANVEVCGNIKYDISPSPEMYALAQSFKQRIGNRPVVVCASTRFYQGNDEAQLLLDAWTKCQTGNILLVIIPRHTERFDPTFAYAQKLNFITQKRSDNDQIDVDTQIWIGDSIGEIFAYYLCASIAFVGGSLVDSGCHNIIEPIACNLPTLFGPSTYNFAEVALKAISAGAAQQIQTADDWAAKTLTLLDSSQQRQKMSNCASDFIQQHRGASKLIAQKINQKIAPIR